MDFISIQSVLPGDLLAFAANGWPAKKFSGKGLRIQQVSSITKVKREGGEFYDIKFTHRPAYTFSGERDMLVSLVQPEEAATHPSRSGAPA